MRVAVAGTVCCLVLFGAPVAPAQTAPMDATTQIVASARRFLEALDDAGRTRVQFPFDSPRKARWSNLPTGIYERGGMRLGDLTPQQRTAAMAVLSTALSPEGYRKVVDIMGGDEVLRRAAPGGGRVAFGEDEYYLAFFGEPSVRTPG